MTDSEKFEEEPLGLPENHINAKPGEGYTPNEAAIPPYKYIYSNDFKYRPRIKEKSKDIQECGCRPSSLKEGEIGCTDCDNVHMLMECHPKYCDLGERCGNQRFQRAQYASIERFKTEKKGYGVRALEDIPEGTFVIEYTGEILSQSAFERRKKRYAKYRIQHYYFMSLNGSEIVDASQKGNISRYFNHSCLPNMETQKWMVRGEICIGLFAKKDIKKGEEMTFDYQYKRNESDRGRPQECYCNAPNCVGWLGGALTEEELARQQAGENAGDNPDTPKQVDPENIQKQVKRKMGVLLKDNRIRETKIPSLGRVLLLCDKALAYPAVCNQTKLYCLEHIEKDIKSESAQTSFVDCELHLPLKVWLKAALSTSQAKKEDNATKEEKKEAADGGEEGTSNSNDDNDDDDEVRESSLKIAQICARLIPTLPLPYSKIKACNLEEVYTEMAKHSDAALASQAESYLERLASMKQRASLRIPKRSNGNSTTTPSTPATGRDTGNRTSVTPASSGRAPNPRFTSPTSGLPGTTRTPASTTRPRSSASNPVSSAFRQRGGPSSGVKRKPVDQGDSGRRGPPSATSARSSGSMGAYRSREAEPSRGPPSHSHSVTGVGAASSSPGHYRTQEPPRHAGAYRDTYRGSGSGGGGGSGGSGYASQHRDRDRDRDSYRHDTRSGGGGGDSRGPPPPSSSSPHYRQSTHHTAGSYPHHSSPYGGNRGPRRPSRFEPVPGGPQANPAPAMRMQPSQPGGTLGTGHGQASAPPPPPPGANGGRGWGDDRHRR